MSVVYTTNLALGQPVTGTESGTWGDDVNNSVTAYLDIAVAGGLAVAITTADVTLTNTQGTNAGTNIGATTAQYAILNISGAMTGARNLIVPSSSKSYIINNATTGGYTLTVKGAATTGVGFVNGEKAIVAWNGTDYIKISSSAVGTVTSVAATVPSIFSIAGSPITSSGTLAMTYSGTALPVVNGGTGLTAGTSGGVLYYSAAGTLASSAALTASSLLVGGGAGAAPTVTTTATGALTFLGTPSSANLAAMVTDETGSGLLVFGTTPTITTAALTNPTVTNYVETPFSANSSTAITLALTNGTVQIITLTGNATITMPTATSGKSFILFLKQDATGSRTVTWSTVKWPGGTAPTITSTASKQDIFSFFADGTNWYGVTVSQNYTP